jgi:hypothetical protein
LRSPEFVSEAPKKSTARASIQRQYTSSSTTFWKSYGVSGEVEPMPFSSIAPRHFTRLSATYLLSSRVDRVESGSSPRAVSAATSSNATCAGASLSSETSTLTIVGTSRFLGRRRVFGGPRSVPIRAESLQQNSGAPAAREMKCGVETEASA